ncbi:hypothetical protein RhiirA1_472285 [Rhizophagus irregularis]|uniref:Protein kinase domain-containing protein n=1 Tax=Rhizophagus irregularis TaxID=588596 RepID=A0A2N0R2P7_9GLOM|nr:hypothetical protein RhiirA1_472285 [Rhizophagus irregularis]
MNKENETRVSTESNELNISDKNSNINLENCCYYCNKPFTKELWCEECDPFRMIEDIKQVGEGAFSKVYSAIWTNGKTKYSKQDDESWKKEENSIKLKVHWNSTNELRNILIFWYCSSHGDKEFQEEEKFGYKGKVIKAMFEEAVKEIPNISTSYEKNPGAIYSSKAFTFNNLKNLN